MCIRDRPLPGNVGDSDVTTTPVIISFVKRYVHAPLSQRSLRVTNIDRERKTYLTAFLIMDKVNAVYDKHDTLRQPDKWVTKVCTLKRQNTQTRNRDTDIRYYPLCERRTSARSAEEEGRQGRQSSA